MIRDAADGAAVAACKPRASGDDPQAAEVTTSTQA